MKHQPNAKAHRRRTRARRMAEEARAEIDEARRKEMLKQARRARLLSFIR